MHFNERWAPIEGFPNYEVSDAGRVRNVRRDRFLKPHFVGKGYLNVRLCNRSGHYMVRLNRLVALTFIGDIPDGWDVDHVNGDKTNNHVSNLEIVTKSENHKRAYATGLQTPRYKSVLCVETGEVFRSITEAAEHFGIRQGNLSNVVSGRRPSIRGYHFREVSPA